MKRIGLAVVVAILLWPATASAAFTHLAFSDEFNGSTANLAAKWYQNSFCNWGPGPPTLDQGCYNGYGTPAVEGYGYLIQNAAYQSDCGSSSCWLSSWLESKTTVTPPLRYVARMQMAPGQGMWGGVWSTNGMEVDNAEHLGRYPNGIHQSVHCWGHCGSGSDTSLTKFTNLASNLTAGFHNYSATVFGDRVVFKVDGAQTAVITDDEVGGSWPTILSPMQFKLTLQIGACGSWALCPNYTDTRTMVTDWIRAYD